MEWHLIEKYSNSILQTVGGHCTLKQIQKKFEDMQATENTRQIDYNTYKIIRV